MEFIIRIQVPMRKLITIFEYLEDDGKLLSIEPVKTKLVVVQRFNGTETGREVIEKFIAQTGKNGPPFHRSVLEQLFRKHGRNAHSVSPILTKLVKEKAIKKLGESQYKVL